ncbi:MAG: DNA polymerase III subunit epsilon [Bacteroidetes bacterium]|nr:MAG: DNA polymerase III subunit epsilon [Bacteroidota bacterium]
MKYAIVDIETTGGYASSHGITEIAIFVHDGEKILERFETLVNPGMEIPYYIQVMTGITNEMVSDAPKFGEVAELVFDKLKDKVFVAHNVNFDYSFLKHHFLETGHEFFAKKLCTVRLTRKVFPNLASYSLGNICRSLQIQIENRHRAGGDAAATVKLFELLLNNNAQPHIEQFLKKTSREQSLPIHLPREQVEQLPGKPGVYYFRDQKGKIIYVGKAKNLRHRVSSHFTHNGSGRQRQEFLRNVYQINFQVCGSELMAAVLEDNEIKKHWPKYNTSQKRLEFQYGLYRFEDRRGYIRLAIERKRKHLQPVYTFGMLWEGYRLLWNMIEKHQLSPELCFVEKNAKTVLPQITVEEPIEYNRKVATALEVFEKELPSFAIMDQGRDEGERSCLLIEKGKFFGMGYIPTDIQIMDLDTLKEFLTPYSDNDYIRGLIYRHAENYPQLRVPLS